MNIDTVICWRSFVSDHCWNFHKFSTSGHLLLALTPPEKIQVKMQILLPRIPFFLKQMTNNPNYSYKRFNNFIDFPFKIRYGNTRAEKITGEHIGQLCERENGQIVHELYFQ